MRQGVQVAHPPQVRARVKGLAYEVETSFVGRRLYFMMLQQQKKESEFYVNETHVSKLGTAFSRITLKHRIEYPTRASVAHRGPRSLSRGDTGKNSTRSGTFFN